MHIRYQSEYAHQYVCNTWITNSFQLMIVQYYKFMFMENGYLEWMAIREENRVHTNFCNNVHFVCMRARPHVKCW